jgi:hypothetical protein
LEQHGQQFRPSRPATDRRLDQSTEKGVATNPNQTHMLTNLMTPDVSKSLTRSAAAHETRPPAWARQFFENWRAQLKWQRLKPYEQFAALIERH